MAEGAPRKRVNKRTEHVNKVHDVHVPCFSVRVFHHQAKETVCQNICKFVLL